MTNRYRIALADGREIVAYGDTLERVRHQAECSYGRVAAVVPAGGL